MFPPLQKCSPTAQHDDANAWLVVERFENEPQLVALRHLDDIQRRPIENNISALVFTIDLDAEAIEHCQARVCKCHRLAHIDS